jgi:formylglycine-generating enzyme required for sulfatase activity
VAAATEGSAEPQEDGVSAEVGGETAVTSSRKSNKEGGTALAAKEPEAGLPENNANAVTALPPEPDPLAVAVERATRWASLQTSQDLTEIIAFAEAESGTEEGLAAANRLAALVAASSRIDELQSAVESATDESSRKIITARIAELQAEIAKEAKRGTAWATASKINTPYAYRAFLKSYPSGAWSDEARDRLIRAGLLEVAVGVGTASEPAWLKPGDPTNGAFKDCANCPEMVTIPVGEYRVPPRRRPGMRSQPEEPVPAVRFNTSFAVSRYEVTALEWEGCVADRRCRRVPTGLAASHAPITDVSWHDAMDYVAWLARKTGKRYRLLSEAEWEYAARAGNERPFIWGERPDAVEAAYRGSDFRRTDTAYRPEVDEPYASKPNAWGLHNLHGNVVEWVDDCWLKGLEALPPTGEPIREKDGADCSHRVLKGGSWVGRAGRRANRAGEIAEARDVFTGFRVARDF